MHNYLSSVVKTRWFVPGATGVTAFVAGVGVGYILGKKRKVEVEPEMTTETIAVPDSKEVAEAKLRHPSNTQTSTKVVLDQKAFDRWKELRDSDDVEEEAQIVSIFKNHDDEWDYEAELATRQEHTPYVIHVDEYMGDEMGFTQRTYTFYETDEVLVDEADHPIYNRSEVVGEIKFGHGSNDQNVVYIRNETLKTEYEILRSEGSYEVEVMGYEAEAKFGGDMVHANYSKFKMD